MTVSMKVLLNFQRSFTPITVDEILLC